MLALQGQLRVGDAPRGKRRQALRPKMGKFFEELSERLSLIVAEHGCAVERREASIRPLFEDQSRPRYPVRTLPMNKMSDDVERAPRVRPLRRLHPFVREPRQ